MFSTLLQVLLDIPTLDKGSYTRLPLHGWGKGPTGCPDLLLLFGAPSPSFLSHEAEDFLQANFARIRAGSQPPLTDERLKPSCC